MRVRALTSFSLGGGRDVHVGDVFDLPADQATQKIKRGWVEQVVAQAAAGRDPEHLTSRDPTTTHRDPAQAGDAGKKGKD